jgi:hypothetical protein
MTTGDCATAPAPALSTCTCTWALCGFSCSRSLPFAIRFLFSLCSLFAVRCSLFAVRCSLFAFHARALTWLVGWLWWHLLSLSLSDLCSVLVCCHFCFAAFCCWICFCVTGGVPFATCCTSIQENWYCLGVEPQKRFLTFD